VRKEIFQAREMYPAAEAREGAIRCIRDHSSGSVATEPEWNFIATFPPQHNTANYEQFYYVV
jgi:hypothetical protein